MGRNQIQLLKLVPIRIAIICGMLAYGAMNLMMTAAPLAIVECGFTENEASDVAMAHVLAMTIPSFFTGHLIIRFGTKPVITFGFALLLTAAAVSAFETELINFYGALVLLVQHLC